MSEALSCPKCGCVVWSDDLDARLARAEAEIDRLCDELANPLLTIPTAWPPQAPVDGHNQLAEPVAPRRPGIPGMVVFAAACALSGALSGMFVGAAVAAPANPATHHPGEACLVDHSSRYCQRLDQVRAIVLVRARYADELRRKGYPAPAFANRPASWNLAVLKRANRFYRAKLAAAHRLQHHPNDAAYWCQRHWQSACRAMLGTARCESGLNLALRGVELADNLRRALAAANGQYRGFMQMGAGERARWGHGSTFRSQSAAAHAYYEEAGWRPWQCQPDGSLQW